MTNEEKILEVLLQVDARLGGIENDVSVLKDDVSLLKNDVSVLKDDVSGTKIQLNENLQIVKAIRHNQEFSNAKLELIETTAAKTDALMRLDSKVGVLNNRLFEQEAAIQTLKLVKSWLFRQKYRGIQKGITTKLL